MCTKRENYMPVDLKKSLFIKILNLKETFRILYPLFGKPDFIFFLLIISVPDQSRHKEIGKLIQIRLHPRSSCYDKRCLRAVQQDRIGFVDDHIVEISQKAIRCCRYQIVKQIIKPQRTMCRIHNIRCIDRLFLRTGKAPSGLRTYTGGNGQSHEAIHPAHLLRVSERKIFVSRQKYRTLS